MQQALYSRYDIAKKEKSKRVWHPFLSICFECAKKGGLEKEYNESDLRSFANENYGCEICGNNSGLSEVRVSYEVFKRLK